MGSPDSTCSKVYRYSLMLGHKKTPQERLAHGRTLVCEASVRNRRKYTFETELKTLLLKGQGL